MPSHSTPHILSAAEDFRHARRQAAMQQIMALLTGQSAELLSFEDVRQKLRLGSSSDQGLREIPLDAIAGSVGRYTDFTRSFLPRQNSDEARWAKVQDAMKRSDRLPPIEVYQIGQVYFVLDGNHRVSAARQLGKTQIKAYVTEFQTKVPLAPDDQPDDLITRAEYAGFLEQTHLDEIRPEADLQVTVPGQYWELETHIEAQRFLLGQEKEREISYEEAIGYWYDDIYLPVVRLIREQGILRDFPNRTETDLYLWIFRHRAVLEKKLGWHIEPQAAAVDLVTGHSHRPQRIVARVEEKILQALTPGQLEAGPVPGQWRRERLGARQNDQLFADILVPVSGEASGWLALDQALYIARHENSQLFGLHVVFSATRRESEAAQAVKAEFDRRCRAAGIPGELSIEVGKVVPKICERARWADLVIMYPANPPGSQLLSRLSSGSRTVIYCSCRPVLTVPSVASPPERVLLAYDGSPKAKEGLFVATYLAHQWEILLVVMTVIEKDRDSEKLAEARQYLEARDVMATFLPVQGNVAKAILETATDHESDLIIMGGYGVKPIREAVLGSKVDQILRESRRSILVCR